MTHHYPDLASASDWLNQISHAVCPIRSSTQIWVVTQHQYGISALIFQMSFGGETSDSVVKCQLFSQASHLDSILLIIFEGLCHSTCVSGDLVTFHKLLSPFLSFWQNRSHDKVFWGADSKDLNPIFEYIQLRNTKSVFRLKNLVYTFSQEIHR